MSSYYSSYNRPMSFSAILDQPLARSYRSNIRESETVHNEVNRPLLYSSAGMTSRSPRYQDDYSHAMGQSFMDYSTIKNYSPGNRAYINTDPDAYLVKLKGKNDRPVTTMTTTRARSALPTEIKSYGHRASALPEEKPAVNKRDLFSYRANPSVHYFTDKVYPDTFFNEAPSVTDMIKKDY